MATCKLCHREMLKADGCTVGAIHIGERMYKRVPVGGSGDFWEGSDESARCGDCNALYGHYHHWGCDAERCPACGRQLISCDCAGVYAEGRGQP